MPKQAWRPAASQLAVTTARHLPHSPQEKCQGTTTTSPGLTERTELPTFTTSATHLCPIAKGGSNGALPPMMRWSRSQVVEATGGTTA